MSVRNQRHLIRLDFQYQFCERRDRISLDVKLRCDEWTDVANILIADVALVRTRVNGNALGTKDFCVACNSQHVRIIAASGIAQCGNLIDIYT